MLPVNFFYLNLKFDFIFSGEVRAFKAKVEHSSNIPGAKDGEDCFKYERDYTCTICCWNRLFFISSIQLFFK